MGDSISVDGSEIDRFIRSTATNGCPGVGTGSRHEVNFISIDN